MTYVIMCVECQKQLSSYERGAVVFVERCRCNDES